MFFSQRYKDLIFNDDKSYNDRISNDVSLDCKKELIETMLEFDEPKKIKKSRYSKETETIGAFHLSILEFNHNNGYNLFNVNEMAYAYNGNIISIFAGHFTPYIFDLIEYQYKELSNKEKLEFNKNINQIYEKYDLPWCLSDGKLIKIDSVQFEMNLKNKTEVLMVELKDSDNVFQSTFDELNKSFESFNKEDYSTAITYANKSYESVLKIYLNVAKGNANDLTKKFSEKINLPVSINNEGFKNSVLMSLPFIRNNATAHGSGSENVLITKEFANLSMNLACALITFVVGEYKKKEGE